MKKQAHLHGCKTDERHNIRLQVAKNTFLVQTKMKYCERDPKQKNLELGSSFITAPLYVL